MEETKLPHERLLNLIIYVLMDQAIITAQYVDNSQMVLLHDAILKMRENPINMCKIEDWVNHHINYVDNPSNNLDPHYYELILDAIGVIYYDDYCDGSITGIQYAEQCENKYSDL